MIKGERVSARLFCLSFFQNTQNSEDSDPSRQSDIINSSKETNSELSVSSNDKMQDNAEAQSSKSFKKNPQLESVVTERISSPQKGSFDSTNENLLAQTTDTIENPDIGEDLNSPEKKVDDSSSKSNTDLKPASITIDHDSDAESSDDENRMVIDEDVRDEESSEEDSLASVIDDTSNKEMFPLEETGFINKLKE